MAIGKSIRVYDLAREVKQDTKRVMEDLRREGADVSVPSNSVSHELAEKVRSKYFPKAEIAPKRGIKVIKAAVKKASSEDVAEGEAHEEAPAVEAAPTAEPAPAEVEAPAPAAPAPVAASAPAEEAPKPRVKVLAKKPTPQPVAEVEAAPALEAEPQPVAETAA